MRPWELQACGKSGPRCQDCGVSCGEMESLGAWGLGAWNLGSGGRGWGMEFLDPREGRCFEVQTPVEMGRRGPNFWFLGESEEVGFERLCS